MSFWNSYDYLVLTPGIQFLPRAISDDFAKLFGVYGVNRNVFDRLQRDVELFASKRTGQNRVPEETGVDEEKCVV